MSAVHDEIAMQALSVQADAVKAQFKSYIAEFKASSCYPDIFADTAMPKEKKDEIDPEADRFIYPLPPTDEWHQRLVKLGAEQYSYSGAEPLSQIYLINFYLKHAVECLQQGDLRSAIKFCGVYSHIIGDICEPIHAMSPALLDVVVPPPHEFLGLELHANVEGLNAPVNITGYQPKLLGANLPQAEMGAFAGLVQAHKFGAAQATPIVQALYAHDKAKATAISSLAQSEAAKHFADFIFTVFSIAKGNVDQKSHYCDLAAFPYIYNTVDMLYRYQPIIDQSLIPYSGGKMVPLALQITAESIEKIHGMGVIPSLGPPFSNDHIRDVDIEYFIVPSSYKKFTAKVGLNPLVAESMPTAEFKVIGDGKVLAESGVLEPGAEARTLTADLGNTRFLTLRMSYVHTPPFDQLNSVSTHVGWASHGVWGEPRLR